MTETPQSHYRTVKRVFAIAVELEHGERTPYLDEVCEGNSRLRREVDRLLEADEKVQGDEQAGNFLPELDVERGVDLDPDDGSGNGRGGLRRDRQFGPYRLIQRIGEGGVSVVYQAVRDDDEYSRRVAVKLLRIGLDSEQTRQRFLTERQILAALDHPSIAKLLDGGTTADGVPYLVMEYIEGSRIDEYCERKGLSVRKRLKLFRKVCSAVQYAHRNLIVHRDLKPSNVLVREEGFDRSEPSTGEGVPKLLDFGIAKLLNPELTGLHHEPTRFDARMMTPQYASPEQIRGEAITTSTDVYSLGVLLYKLLTGRLPYKLETASFDEISRVICEEDPIPPSVSVTVIEEGCGECSEDSSEELGFPAPSAMADRNSETSRRLARRLQGDLDTILLKALRKEPERRYASVEQFSEDIERHLSGLPVIARKATMGYRVGKFLARHRVGVAFAAVLTVLVLSFAGATLVQSARIREALAVAEQEREFAEREGAKARAINEFLQETLGAANPQAGGTHEITVVEALKAASRRIDDALDQQPEIQAAVRHTIGSTLAELGRHREAERLLLLALDQRKRRLGAMQPEVAETLHALGLLRDQQGDYKAAQTLFQEALAILRATVDEAHPDIALNLGDLGLAFWRQGDFATARRLHREALAIRRTLFGSEHSAISESLHNLGVLAWATGDFDDAERFLRQSLAIEEKLHQKEHISIAETMAGLAVVLSESGNYHEAEKYHRETLRVYRVIFGDEHPRIALALLNLGLTLRQQGDHAAAESLMLRSLDMRRRLLGEEHSDIAFNLNHLGLLALDQGHYDKSEELLRQALAMRVKLLGAEHEQVAKTLNFLGTALTGRGDLPAAESMFAESLRISENALTEGHWWIARIKSNYAACLTEIGRHAQAAALLEQALPILRAALGPDHRHTRLARERLKKLPRARGGSRRGEVAAELPVPPPTLPEAEPREPN